MTLAPNEKYQLMEEAAAAVDADPALALARLQPLLDEEEKGMDLLILCARALINLGRCLDAAGYAKMALDRHGLSQEAFALWLHALGHGGDYAGQEAAVEFGLSQPRMEYRNLLLMAETCRFLGLSERAEKLFELLIRNRPEEAELHAKLGLVRQSAGDLDGAEACFAAAIEKDGGAAQNYYLLSCARGQSNERNNVSLLRKAWADAGAAKQPDEHQRAYLAYALGKEYEDLEKYGHAFDWYQTGARAFRSVFPHSAKEEAAFYESIMSFHRRMENQDAAGYEEASPIFIVGMPRTGSTLIDTILSRHSRVYSAGELNTFGEALKAQTGYYGSGALARMLSEYPGPLDRRSLGERYVRLTRTSLAGSRRTTDKMPRNHILLGIIARALPKASIICTERNPADVCLSNFKQIFQPGSYSYSYTLEETARHVLLHRDLTEFWVENLPGRIHVVRYEDLVADTEATVRSLLDFCGLGWEPGCLEFRSSLGSVNTASAAQVRQPIYRSSVEKWRCYAKPLQPALDILRDGGVRVE